MEVTLHAAYVGGQVWIETMGRSGGVCLDEVVVRMEGSRKAGEGQRRWLVQMHHVPRVRRNRRHAGSRSWIATAASATASIGSPTARASVHQVSAPACMIHAVESVTAYEAPLCTPLSSLQTIMNLAPLVALSLAASPVSLAAAGPLAHGLG